MAVYGFMLSVSIPKVMEYSGGLKLLDMMPLGYDAEYVNQLMTALGDEGRSAYLYRQIPFDMAYPGLFAITWCLIFAFVLKKTGKLDTPLFYFSYLPIIAGLADYLENISVITIIKTWSETSGSIYSMASIFSLTKSMVTTFFYIALIILLIYWGIMYFTTRKSHYLTSRHTNLK